MLTQSWVTKTVWQQIPGRQARNSKTPTTKTASVQAIMWNDQIPLTDRPQMLTTSNVGSCTTDENTEAYLHL